MNLQQNSAADVKFGTTKGEAYNATSNFIAKRKRTSQDAHDVPWTAARCNRLLRSLNSRISILRKLSASFRRSISDGDEQSCESVFAAASSDVETQPRASTIIEIETAEDPDWLQSSRPKVPLQTFQSRRRGGRQVSLSHHEDGLDNRNDFLSTPFVKRLVHPPPSEGKLASSNTRDGPEQRQPKRRKQLVIRANNSREEAQRNLVAAYGSLLESTQPPTQESRIGARSLLSTCIRKVPAYIAVETRILKKELGDDAPDPTSEVYEDLESMGTGRLSGWSGLREVVRAHGTRLVCEAVREKLLSDVQVEGLIKACVVDRPPVQERMALLRAWIRRDTCADTFVRPSHPALRLMQEFRSKLDIEAFYLRSLDDILTQGYGDITSFCNQAVLKRLLAALMHRSSHDAAASLLLTLATSVAGNSRDTSTAAQTTLLKRFAAAIVAIGMANVDETTWQTTSLTYLVHRITTTLGLDTSSSANATDPAVLPVATSFGMASLLFQSLDQSAEQEHKPLDLEPLLVHLFCSENNRGILPSTGDVQLMADFICDVARQVSRITGQGEITCLQAILGRCVSSARCRLDTLRSFLSQVALEAASTFAARTGETQILGFVERIASGTQTEGLVPCTPVKLSGTRYRWEEGLSEWIAATPFTEHQEAAVDVNIPGDVVQTPMQPMRSQRMLELQVDLLLSPDILSATSPMVCQASKADTCLTPEVATEREMLHSSSPKLREQSQAARSSTDDDKENLALDTSSFRGDYEEPDELAIPTPKPKRKQTTARARKYCPSLAPLATNTSNARSSTYPTNTRKRKQSTIQIDLDACSEDELGF